MFWSRKGGDIPSGLPGNCLRTAGPVTGAGSRGSASGTPTTSPTPPAIKNDKIARIFIIKLSLLSFLKQVNASKTACQHHYQKKKKKIKKE